MTALTIQQSVLICCAGLLVWAAYSDIRSYLIPNRICLAIVALYPAYVLAGWAGGIPVDWSGGVLAAALVFAISFVLFSLRIMGGGDVKLFAAVALWTGLEWLIPLLIVIALAGGILSFGMIGAKAIAVLRLPADLRTVAYPGSRIGTFLAFLKIDTPYGAAIAFGGLFIIYRLLGLRLL